MKGFERTHYCLAAAVLVAMFSAAVGAEEAAQQGTATNVGPLEEIVVTARKREESLRDIPTSIDAFSGERLDELGYYSVEDILKLSPGVTFESGFSPSSTSIIVRGITNDSRGVGPRTVGRFYGSVPLTNPSIMGVEPDLDTFDMQTVEVLKGPQGTLFGGSALAGAMRYVPNSPDFERFHGATSLGAGRTASSSNTTKNAALMLNVPFSETFAMRFAGSIRDNAGWIDDTRSGESDINDFEARQGRLMAAWRPLDDVLVEAQYLEYRGDLGAFNWVEGTEPTRDRTQRSLDDSERAEVELYGVSLSWDTEPATAVLEVNRLQKDRDQLNDVTIFAGLFGTGITAGQNFLESTDQDTVEFRIVSNRPSQGPGLFGGWDYTLGLFYMDSDQTRPVIINLAFSDQLIRQGGGAVVNAEESAVFFDLTRTFDAPFELNLGGRYFRQRTSGGTFEDFSFSSAAPGGLPSEIPFVPDAENFIRLRESDFNPKAALRWFASDEVTIIASYTKGFRFGGINGDQAQLEDAIFDTDVEIPFTYESDTIHNWEFGVRSTWLDDRLTVDVTAFYIDWRNLQILQRAGVFAFTDNVGRAEVRGVEFGFGAALTEHWSLTLNGSYQDAETKRDFESGEFGFIPSGTTLPQAPHWTGATQLRHVRTYGDFSLDGAITYSYRSSSKNNLLNTIPLDSFGTFDIALSAQNTSLALQPRLSLIGKNLADEEAAQFGFTLGGTANAVSINQPRQVLLKLDLYF